MIFVPTWESIANSPLEMRSDASSYSPWGMVGGGGMVGGMRGGKGEGGKVER